MCTFPIWLAIQMQLISTWSTVDALQRWTGRDSQVAVAHISHFPAALGGFYGLLAYTRRCRSHAESCRGLTNGRIWALDDRLRKPDGTRKVHPWNRGIRVSVSVSVQKMTNAGSWMKTNGPGKMLFIIERLWVVLLSKSGPSLFSKTRRDTHQSASTDLNLICLWP